jgi:hypothetical protein
MNNCGDSAMAGEGLTCEEVSIERLVASIDDQIAPVKCELEAERVRVRDERARAEIALQEFHRITAELARLKASPWWRRRAG